MLLSTIIFQWILLLSTSIFQWYFAAIYEHLLMVFCYYLRASFRLILLLYTSIFSSNIATILPKFGRAAGQVLCRVTAETFCPWLWTKTGFKWHPNEICACRFTQKCSVLTASIKLILLLYMYCILYFVQYMALWSIHTVQQCTYIRISNNNIFV